MREDLIKSGTKRRPGTKRAKTVFIVAHDTGNLGSTAKNNVDYYKRTADEMSASAHMFVDDIETVVCVPLDEKAWHVRYDVTKDNELYGDDANDIAMGVELCYFDSLERSLKAYERYVDEIANLCKHYNIRSIIGHYALDPPRKTDPVNAFKRIGKTWNGFLSDVNIAIAATDSKRQGIDAINYLAKAGRVLEPGYWKQTVLEVKNLEYMFIKWREDHESRNA